MHPTRVLILQHLLEHEQGSPADLAEALAIPIPTVSYHMRRLHEAGQLTLTRHLAKRGVVVNDYRLANPHASAKALRRLGLPVRVGEVVSAGPGGREWAVLKRAITDLRERREAQGITRETLARRIGVKTSYLGHVERYETDPRYTVLADLARELGTTLGEVFTRAEAGQ